MPEAAGKEKRNGAVFCNKTLRVTEAIRTTFLSEQIVVYARQSPQVLLYVTPRVLPKQKRRFAAQKSEGLSGWDFELFSAWRKREYSAIPMTTRVKRAEIAPHKRVRIVPVTLPFHILILSRFPP